MRTIIDVSDLTVKELNDLMKVAIDIEKHPKKYRDICKYKKLAALFYEPSTRTRLSFTAAMMELGGNVIGFSGGSASSQAKGESFADTAKVVSNYADIIAVRSPVEGTALVMARNANIPLINAGDGAHFHPTQTLADLLTIYKEKKRMDNLTIGVCGDLKYGRAVNSLISAMCRYKNNKFVLISPKELRLTDEVKKRTNIKFIETTSLENALPKLDVLYMTRIQRERFDDMKQYERLKNSYCLDVKKMRLAKKTMIVLHPLPRVNEISVKVDNDPRACYFKQCLNGKLMRMALILKLLNEKTNKQYEIKGKLAYNKYKCNNKKCISQCEQELDQVHREVKKGVFQCVYCDKEVKS